MAARERGRSDRDDLVRAVRRMKMEKNLRIRRDRAGELLAFRRDLTRRLLAAAEVLDGEIQYRDLGLASLAVGIR